MGFDLFFGKRGRNWARDPDLLRAPAVPAAPEAPASALVRKVREVDDRVKVRRADGGATVSTKFRWG